MPPWPFSRRREEGAGNAVDRAPLLALLEADLRQRVRRRMSRRKIAAGKPLYRPGDVADALYLIESGRLRVFMHQRGGAGVTTLALNLAIALAERHPDDAVLLDLDVLFGHTLLNLRLEARGVLAQVGPNTLRGLDRGGLEHYLIKHASSLRIFPAA